MDKILMDHDDVLVSAVIIYAHSGDPDNYPYAYKDEDCTIPMNNAELEEAFKKGALVRLGNDEFCVPVRFKPYNGIIFHHWIGSEMCERKARSYDPEEE